MVGTYLIEGLTPGADYAVYVDEILAGGFSTTPFTPLPGPEEFYNGVNESFDSNIDDPSVFTAVNVAAGNTATGIDILFNTFNPGDNLPVGDDGAVTLFPSFSFCFCGQSFDSLFVNANGSISFGGADATAAPTAQGMLDGPARLAALWTDLDASSGGTVSFSETAHTFTVTWDGVPEFGPVGSNTFSITLRNNGYKCHHGGGHHLAAGSVADGEEDPLGAAISSYESETSDLPASFFGADATIDYGGLSATGGLAGASCGIFATNGIEPQVDLSAFGHRRIRLGREAALFEHFESADNDLAGSRGRYDVSRRFRDVFERNNSMNRARRVHLPFSTVSTRRSFSSIDPAAADVDYYKVRNLEAGQTLVAQVLRGQIDSVLGVFDSAGNLLNSPQADDDAGGGLLSRSEVLIPADGDYFVAVSFCCDYDLDGVDPGQGGVLDFGRYILDIDAIDP